MRNMMIVCFALCVAFAGFAATPETVVVQTPETEQQIEGSKEVKNHGLAADAIRGDVKKDDKGCGCGGGKPKQVKK